MASETADLVMALKTTRWICVFPLIARLLRNASSKCQLIASPSRSGSVAKIRVLSFFNASDIALMCFLLSVDTSHNISKLFCGSTDPSLGGKSLT